MYHSFSYSIKISINNSICVAAIMAKSYVTYVSWPRNIAIEENDEAAIVAMTLRLVKTG
jgi:hypothetical protein